MIPEKEIFLKIAKNDKQALRQLFDMFFDELVRYALSLLNNADEAEETVQDYFISVWEKRKNLNSPENLRAYLFTAIKFQCINKLKKRKHLFADVDELINVHISESTDSKLEYEELSAALKDAINQLPPKSRDVFSLSRNARLSNPEIAEELGVSIKTVEYHISYALKFLREFLHKYWYVIVVVAGCH